MLKWSVVIYICAMDKNSTHCCSLNFKNKSHKTNYINIVIVLVYFCNTGRFCQFVSPLTPYERCILLGDSVNNQHVLVSVKLWFCITEKKSSGRGSVFIKTFCISYIQHNYSTKGEFANSCATFQRARSSCKRYEFYIGIIVWKQRRQLWIWYGWFTWPERWHPEDAFI